MPIKSYRDLEVWRRSMQLAESLYPLVRRFPIEERFALSAQLRRAVVSIPSNIAEGSGYGKTRRYVHHLRIAAGSNSELQTQVMLAERLSLIGREQVEPLLDESEQIGRMLSALISSLEQTLDRRTQNFEPPNS